MDNKFKSAIAFGGFIIFVIVMGIFSSDEDEMILQETEIETNSSTSEIIESGEEEKIFVYVIGAVNKPGVIEVSVDSRLYEIIELAGGLAENADQTAINLAQTVVDEEKIIIPYKEEASTKRETQKINQLFTETHSNNFGKININIAGVEELQTLSGIGKSTAEKIVNYRNENGKFEKIEDIKNVSGIGESKYEKEKSKSKT